MTQNFDWLQWQSAELPTKPVTSIETAAVATHVSEKALAHFRNVGKTLMKYNYKALALSPKGISPAPYYLHITRTHVTLSESTAGGALQTRLVLSDGALLRGGQLASPDVFAHFSKMVNQIQAALANNDMKIHTKNEEAESL
jgi:hypothetical protein